MPRHLVLTVAAALGVIPLSFISAQDTAPSQNAPPAQEEVVKGCGPVGPHPCTPPRATYMPEPNYSEKARKKKIEGSVLLSVVIGTDGLPRDIHVTRPLGYGLDEKAVEAVQKWKFTPAMREGHPVATEVAVQVQFKLY